MLRCPGGGAISVSALCATAGVSRPTFYQHFASVDEVAVASVERRFARLASEVAPGPDMPARLLAAFLSELEAERGPWQRTIGGRDALVATRDAVEGWFAGRLAERSPGASPVEVRYAAAGFLGAVRAWLLQEDGPDRPSAAELAAHLAEVTERVLGPAACGAPGSGTRSRLGS